MKNIEQKIIENLLKNIKQSFYQKHAQKRFYQDKHMLIYAITWPATWFEQRALKPTSNKYQQLIQNILDNIANHGKPQQYQQYFPRYLLKCIQQWFHFNGEQLYEELKHIRNHIYAIDELIKHIQNNKHTNEPTHHIEVMTKTHFFIKSQKQTAKHKNNPKQLKLF